MSLKDRIEADYRSAFKAKKESVLAALRLLKAAVKNAEIAKRKNFEDDEVIAVVNREAKKIKDSIAAYTQGKRADLVREEEAQLAALAQYLPAQLSEAELEDIIHDVINRLNATGPADFGTVMKEVMKVTAGQADGARVKTVTQKQLAAKTGG